MPFLDDKETDLKRMYC